MRGPSTAPAFRSPGKPAPLRAVLPVAVGGRHRFRDDPLWMLHDLDRINRHFAFAPRIGMTGSTPRVSHSS
jgi:hypothetical protein